LIEDWIDLVLGNWNIPIYHKHHSNRVLIAIVIHKFRFDSCKISQHSKKANT